MNNPYWDQHVENLVTNLMNKIRWNPHMAVDCPQNVFKPVPNQPYVFKWTGGFRRMSHVEWKTEAAYITVTERDSEIPRDLRLPQHVMRKVRKILTQNPDATFALTFEGFRTGRWIVRETP